MNGQLLRERLHRLNTAFRQGALCRRGQAQAHRPECTFEGTQDEAHAGQDQNRAAAAADDLDGLAGLFD